MNIGIFLLVFFGTCFASYLLTRHSLSSIVIGCILAGIVASIEYLPLDMVDNEIPVTQEAEIETMSEINYDNLNQTSNAAKEEPMEPSQASNAVKEEPMEPSQASNAVKEEPTEPSQVSNAVKEEPNTKDFYIDITGLQEVKDNIDEKGQVNTYVFIPPISGLYRFELSELKENAMVHIAAYNELNEQITAAYARNGDGITIRDMTMGETYKIKVMPSYKLSDYMIKIGYQNEVKNINNLPYIEGNIYYHNQVDIYKFTPPISGLYRFDISELSNYARMHITIYNRLGEIVAGRYLVNNEGLTVNNMNIGEEYQICVEQTLKYSYYLLNIGYQKPAIDVSGITQVTGEITFNEQEDIYFFTANISGNYRFDIHELRENATVAIRVYNRLEENIKSSYLKTGEGMTVYGINAGEQYKIIVKQSFKHTGYVLRYSIQE